MLHPFFLYFNTVSYSLFCSGIEHILFIAYFYFSTIELESSLSWIFAWFVI